MLRIVNTKVMYFNSTTLYNVSIRLQEVYGVSSQALYIFNGV